MPAIDIKQIKQRTKPQAAVPATSSLTDILNKDIRFNKELSDRKKEYFYLELGSLLTAGINLKDGLELVLTNQQKARDQALFQSIAANVVNGMALSAAIQKSEEFSMYEVYSLQIGEETGKLTEILQDLAQFYRNKVKQRRKIVSALTYPCIVLSTSLAAVFFMLKFIVPVFGDVFKRFGGHLPWITERIIALSAALEHAIYPLLIITALISGSLFLLRKNERYRHFVSQLVLHIPVVGELVQKIYLARFCNAMRLLINARLPLLRALGLIRQMINYYPVTHSLKTVEQDILHGRSLHESMQNFEVYPKKMIQLIKVGEETNQLDYFFAKIAEQYVEEIEYRTSALSSMMEPLIIIFLGLIVGIIVVSMYLPLFQMSNSFQ